MPLYKRVTRLVTLYRRLAIRWPAHPKTFRTYGALKAAVVRHQEASR